MFQGYRKSGLPFISAVSTDQKGKRFGGGPCPSYATFYGRHSKLFGEVDIKFLQQRTTPTATPPRQRGHLRSRRDARIVTHRPVSVHVPQPTGRKHGCTRPALHQHNGNSCQMGAVHTWGKRKFEPRRTGAGGTPDHIFGSC